MDKAQDEKMKIARELARYEMAVNDDPDMSPEYKKFYLDNADYYEHLKQQMIGDEKE